ncbi:MAG: amino acid ABC transporter permease [Acetobacteraceae bacterium]|nr:amino acid ABC transporter permease [Acetobacteraceae bacterium]
MDFRMDVVARILPYLLKGAVLTLELTTISVGLGVILGLFVALARISKSPILRFPAGAFIDFFRGTPLLAQLYLIHYGLPRLLGYTPNAWASGILALTLNASAYIAEIYRAGIQSIERGQMEASRSLGMTYGQAMRWVVIPQAVRRVVPPLGNEYIAMLKDSSLVSIISIEELMWRARLLNGSNMRSFEDFFTAAIIYLIMTLFFSWLLQKTERRLRTGDIR